MPLSWNEIKNKALAFSKRWEDATREDSDAKPFWIDFFEIFGISDKRVASFEHAVKKLPGAKARTDGFVDLFWPGMLLVEHKSRGKDLDKALDQAMAYLPGIAERDLPQVIVVCDFGHFRVRHLASGDTREFALKDLHKHVRQFGFIAGYKTQEIKAQDPVNIRAAERMGKLHDALKAKGKAAVHCVIVGFGLDNRPNKTIYEYEDIKGEPLAVPATNINPYLVDFPDLLLQRRSKPVCAAPPLVEGITPLDNGILAFTSEEKQAFLNKEPAAERWFRPMLTGNDFINNKQNHCLWLSNATASELRSMPHVMAKVAEVKRFRENSKSSQKFAATPWLFRETTIPDRYILIPKTSSERRAYFPLGFVENVVVTNSTLYMDGGGVYEFGMLSSTMHNAWVRNTCGRLKSDFRYSKDIVYNNYPWPDLPADAAPGTPAHKARAAIEAAAQGVLDARAQVQQGEQPASLADLYDPLTMPPALLKAHQKLDAAVDAAYALCGGKKSWKNDAERVAFLFELYQRITSLLPTDKPKRKRPVAPQQPEGT